MGKLTISMAIFNSYVTNYQGYSGELIAIGDLILHGLLGIMMGPKGSGNRFQPTNVFHEME